MDIIQLWEEYSSELENYLRKITSSKEEAEDIASEVFLKVIKSQNLLGGMCHKQCHLWIYTTVKHLVIDIARKRKLESKVVLPLDLTFDDLSPIAVTEVIGLLPDDLQDLIGMRYFAGMDSTTIGKTLGIPPATVRTRLRKACALLRKNWNND